MRSAILTAVLLSGAAQAASTFTAAGVTYVDLKGFAQDNRLTLTVSGTGIVLKGRGKTVTLYPFSKAAKLNGAGWTLASPVIVDRNVPSAPLADMQRAFGVTTAPTPVPAASAPARPTATPAPAPAPVDTPTYRVVQAREAATFDDLLAGEDAIRYPENSAPKVDGLFKLCRTMTENDLKSPATAQYSDEVVFAYPANHWMVIGTVDAQNGYGALVRGTYACHIRWTGSEMQFYNDITTRR